MAAAETHSRRSAIVWDQLATGSEFSGTVLMASGFVLPMGQRVREHYRIDRVLGQGGMGRVFAVSLAGSPDPQLYALKMVARANTESPDDHTAYEAAQQQAHWFAELLRQEAAKQDLVQRHGVSVARLFALVQLDDGSMGLRMEMARGRSIEARLDEELEHRERAPDSYFAVLMARKMLAQLRRLHEMTAEGSPFGFIHSDIKPGNVFVDEGDRIDPQLTLLDFGVATAGQAMAKDLVTRGGRQTLVLEQAGGTIGYAPPHHFTGRPTPLSDVFASMVILYELITLEPPWDFQGVSRTPANLFEIEARMRNLPRPVRTVRPSVPEDQARALDAFFAHEFPAMVQLASQAANVLKGKDDTARREMIDRLTSLAREYQSKLDRLASHLAPRRQSEHRALAPVQGSIHSSHAEAATAAPPRPGANASGGFGKRHDTPLTGSSRMDLQGLRPPIEQISTFHPVARRRNGGRGAAVPIIALLLALPLALLAYAKVQGVPPSVLPFVPASVRAALLPNANVPGTMIHDPVQIPAAGTTVPPGEAQTSVSVAALGQAPVVARPPELEDTEDDAPVGPDAGTALAAAAAGTDAQVDQRCSCVAPVPGAHVLAHSGSMEQPSVLCSTDESRPEHGGFTGRGVIPANVFGAFPTLSCLAEGETLTLTVQRYVTANGTVPLFRCERVAPAVSPIAAAAVPQGTDAIDGGIAAPTAPTTAPTPAPTPAPIAPTTAAVTEDSGTAPADAAVSPIAASTAAGAATTGTARTTGTAARPAATTRNARTVQSRTRNTRTVHRTRNTRRPTHRAPARRRRR